MAILSVPGLKHHYISVRHGDRLGIYGCALCELEKVDAVYLYSQIEELRVHVNVRAFVCVCLCV